jgi:hypothetical protein
MCQSFELLATYRTPSYSPYNKFTIEGIISANIKTLLAKIGANVK